MNYFWLKATLAFTPGIKEICDRRRSSEI